MMDATISTQPTKVDTIIITVVVLETICESELFTKPVRTTHPHAPRNQAYAADLAKKTA